MAGEEEPFVGLMIAAVVCSCTVGPWLLSLLATMIYQPRKRKVLLEREWSGKLLWPSREIR